MKVISTLIFAAAGFMALTGLLVFLVALDNGTSAGLGFTMVFLGTIIMLAMPKDSVY